MGFIIRQFLYDYYFGWLSFAQKEPTLLIVCPTPMAEYVRWSFRKIRFIAASLV